MLNKPVTLIILLLSVCLPMLAQNRLEPCDRGHYRIWQNIFDRYYNEGAWYQYIVKPSFTPPYALYLRYPMEGRASYILEAKDKEQTYKMQCDTTVYLRLAALMEYAVHTAQYPLSGRLGLDGVQYFFFESEKGTTIWTPQAHSIAALLTTLMDNVWHAVKQQNSSAIHQQREQIDSLTYYFKSLIPDEEQICASENSLGGVNLHNRNNNIYLVFPQTKESPDAIKNKYGKLFLTVSRWLFLHTSVIDLNGHIDMTVKADDMFTDDTFKHLPWRYYLTVKESDLTEERLIAVLRKRFASQLYLPK